MKKDSGLISKWERGTLRMSATSFLELVKLYGAAQHLADWLLAVYAQPEAALTSGRRVAAPAPIEAFKPLAKPSGKNRKRN